MMNAVELTRELIAVESTNPGMGESDMERFILRYLYGTGAALASEEVFPGRNNVMATLTGEEAAPSLVFVCHMDTVVEARAGRAIHLGQKKRMEGSTGAEHVI